MDRDRLEIGVLGEEYYQNVTGYDPGFLGEGFEVPLPSLNKAQQEDAVQTKDGGVILDYMHFSIVMSKSRRLAYFTAVNIDGNQLTEVERKNDRWYYDPRIGEQFQTGEEVYRQNDLDRGHLVRRQDPNWGPDAETANEHTFHFTNCAPQHKNFNQRTWLDLEDYLIEHARERNFKVSVFTGPVFRENDVEYRGVQLPAEYWKVAVMVKGDGKLSATAYLQSQADQIRVLDFVYGEFETYQVPVSRIEKLTFLDFGQLRESDPLLEPGKTTAAQAEGRAMLIENLHDVRL